MPQPGFIGDVLESAATHVPVQGAARTRRIASRVHGERIDEIQVRETVVVVIEHRDAARHRLDDVLFFWSGVMAERQACLGGDVPEEQFRGRGRLRYGDDERCGGDWNAGAHHHLSAPPLD
jgi:hypothetical protein